MVNNRCSPTTFSDHFCALHKDKFSTVVNLLDGTAADCAEADQTSELINVFLAYLGPHHREHLLDQLARAFASYDRPDLAGTELDLPAAGSRREGSRAGL